MERKTLKDCTVFVFPGGERVQMNLVKNFKGDIADAITDYFKEAHGTPADQIFFVKREDRYLVAVPNNHDPDFSLHQLTAKEGWRLVHEEIRPSDVVH